MKTDSFLSLLLNETVEGLRGLICGAHHSGPLDEVVPYLLRRTQENSTLLGTPAVSQESALESKAEGHVRGTTIKGNYSNDNSNKR